VHYSRASLGCSRTIAGFREASIHIYLRGGELQLIRLCSGLVLFAFAAAHFINHAVALISLEAMHEMQAWRMAVTRSWPGTAILFASFVAHIGLALIKLAQRRTLRMPLWELLQIAIALAIPFMLFPHIVDTRIGSSHFGIGVNYLYELYYLWPAKAVGSIALIFCVWIHSCVGLHYWLRLGSGYHRVAPLLLILAVLVPFLAAAGFVVGGQRTREIMADPEALAAFKERVRWPSEADRAVLDAIGLWTKVAFGSVLALVGLAYGLRRGGRPVRVSSQQLARDGVRVSYVDGPTFVAKEGMTILEVSRSAGVPQASVCGGRARCATCQVKVTRGADDLPSPERPEAALLAATQAPLNIRLACQLRPTAPLSIEVLFRPEELAPIPVEFTELKEVAAAHMRACLSGEITDISADDRAALVEWLDRRFGDRVPLAQLAAARFEMRGARVDYLNNRPVLAIAFIIGQFPVTLSLLPRTGSEPIAVRGYWSGCNVVSWNDDNFIYFAASEASRDSLEQFEEDFQKRSLRSDELLLATADQDSTQPPADSTFSLPPPRRSLSSSLRG
jgi:ferredoxin